MNRDLKSNLKLVQSIKPAVINTDTEGGAVDLQGFDSCMIVVHAGQSADSLSDSNKIELELEHSDNGTDWHDCEDSDLDAPVEGSNDGTFAVIDGATDDEQIYAVGYKGSKRYVRPVLNFSGTHSTGTPISALAVLGHAAHKPVA